MFLNYKSDSLYNVRIGLRMEFVGIAGRPKSEVNKNPKLLASQQIINNIAVTIELLQGAILSLSRPLEF